MKIRKIFSENKIERRYIHLKETLRVTMESGGKERKAPPLPLSNDFQNNPQREGDDGSQNQDVLETKMENSNSEGGGKVLSSNGGATLIGDEAVRHDQTQLPVVFISTRTQEDSYSNPQVQLNGERGKLVPQNWRRPAMISRKSTYRSLLIHPHHSQDTTLVRNMLGKGSKLRTELGSHATTNVSDFLTREREVEESFTNSLGLAFPGAFHVPGPQPSFDTEEVDSDELSTPCSGTVVDEHALRNDEILQVQAHVVPETQDIERMVSRRVSEEVQARLEEERENGVVAKAEVLMCSIIPRRLFFWFLLLSILAAISLGAAFGTPRGRAAADMSLAAVSPSFSPTIWSRSSIVQSALVKQVKGTDKWNEVGSPQYYARNWLISQDTFDLQALTLEQILERYALAVLFFYDVQPQGSSNSISFFLQPDVSVCEWRKPNATNGVFAGVKCSDGVSVSEIRLSKFPYNNVNGFCF